MEKQEKPQRTHSSFAPGTREGAQLSLPGRGDPLEYRRGPRRVGRRIIDVLPRATSTSRFAARVSPFSEGVRAGGLRRIRVAPGGRYHVQDDLVGEVEVFYDADKPKADEGPFLKDERRLINAVAERLGLFHPAKTASFGAEELGERRREDLGSDPRRLVGDPRLHPADGPQAPRRITRKNDQPSLLGRGGRSAGASAEVSLERRKLPRRGREPPAQTFVPQEPRRADRHDFPHRAPALQRGGAARLSPHLDRRGQDGPAR